MKEYENPYYISNYQFMTLFIMPGACSVCYWLKGSPLQTVDWRWLAAIPIAFFSAASNFSFMRDGCDHDLLSTNLFGSAIIEMVPERAWIRRVK